MTEFAVFRTLGATKGKKTRQMIGESTILSIISITVGMISGILFGVGYLIISREVTVPPHNAFLLELTISFHLLFLTMGLIGVIVLMVNFIYVRKISRLQVNAILKGE
jgi:ABC-type antimicrobial peptide transport system permease subunit